MNKADVGLFLVILGLAVGVGVGIYQQNLVLGCLIIIAANNTAMFISKI